MSVAVFDALHRSEGPRLARFFSRTLRNSADAADATQETYLRLLTALARTPIDNPQAYLFQIARNVAASAGARRNFEARLFGGGPEDMLNAVDGAARVEEQVAARQSLRRLAAAIDELPPRCRETFLLSRFDGLSNGEIAARQGVSRNMVEKHIIRALLHCRTRCLDLF